MDKEIQHGAHGGDSRPSFGDVVKLIFFVPDPADLLAVRAARDAVIHTDRQPASTAVKMAALFAPGYLLEVEAGGPGRRLTTPTPAMVNRLTVWAGPGV
jgi:hypothetical protein